MMVSFLGSAGGPKTKLCNAGTDTARGRRLELRLDSSSGSSSGARVELEMRLDHSSLSSLSSLGSSSEARPALAPG